MDQQKPDQIVHLALNDEGRVVAHFLDSDDAQAWCLAKRLTHLPYNRLNRDGDMEPVVGSVYRA